MNRTKEFIQHLETEKEACLKNANALLQDDREDEADFAKIRANIFGIVLSVCRAAESQVPANPVAFIQNKLDTIPRAWEESLAAARQYGDHAKETVERLKLETIAEINAALAAIMESKL